MFSSATRHGMSAYGASSPGDSWTWTSVSTMKRSSRMAFVSRWVGAACVIMGRRLLGCASRLVDDNGGGRTGPLRHPELLRRGSAYIAHLRDVVLIQFERTL